MPIDGGFLTFVRETVTIVRPMHSVVPRGKASPRVNQPTMSLRLPEEHREAIFQAADMLDVTRSEFIRWCAYHVALEVLKQKAEYDKRNA